MDTIGARGSLSDDKGTAVPRFSTEPNDTLTKADMVTLGGFAHVWNDLVLPNYGDGKVIRRTELTEDGGLRVWYNFKNLGYAEDEKHNIIEFLKGIEMSQANNKWKKK